ncbi:DMT family transporter [Formosa sp. A9]|uniref:DMT family transporter n=1 Tax=Formosa sp. A9 TaxID=3442641 RepID=UPI003EBF65FF
MALFIASVKLLPMRTAVSIRYIAPIFATFFAVLWLKEKMKPRQWLFFLIAFIGVLILKGIDRGSDFLGLIYAIGSSIFAGLATLYFWIPPKGIDWLIFASLGVFGYAAQLYMTKAFQAAETNEVAPLKYAEVIFTMLIGLVWFNEIYTLYSLLGIFLIVIDSVYI